MPEGEPRVRGSEKFRGARRCRNAGQVAPGTEESLAGLVQAGIALERPLMAFQAWCPTVQQLSLPTGLPTMGYGCAGVQEPEPSGVCTGLRGAWLDLEGGHPSHE